MDRDVKQDVIMMIDNASNSQLNVISSFIVGLGLGHKVIIPDEIGTIKSHINEMMNGMDKSDLRKIYTVSRRLSAK